MVIAAVRLFARAKELAGTDKMVFELVAGATVQDLRDRLRHNSPALAPFLERCAIAINCEIAKDTTVLPDKVEVAILPPVSGG